MNDQTLEILENRVSQLEKTFGINQYTVVEAIHDRSISQQVTALEEKLNSSLTEGLKKNVNSKLKKYEAQKEYLDQLHKDPTFMLSLSEKTRLLSIYEPNIDNMLEDLQKIKDLAKYLDFDPMMEREAKTKTLEPIEIDFAEQTNEFLYQDEKFRQMLEVYNQSIRDINMHFMYLESLVTKLENKK